MSNVADRPGKPQDVELSACQQTFAVVTWSSAADNNAPITGFIVYYATSHDDSEMSAGNGPHVGARVGASEVSARVQLAPWTRYWFSVAAVNDVGAGDRAEAVVREPYVGVGNRSEVVVHKPCETEAGRPSRSPNSVCTKSQRPDQLVIVWEVRL